MAAGDTLQGRRLPPDDQRLLEDPSDAQPGDYALLTGYTGDKPALFFVKPNGSRGHITFPPHSYTENEDGAITVSPSISDEKSSDPGDGSTSDGWHGYLEAGVWREV